LESGNTVNVVGNWMQVQVLPRQLVHEESPSVFDCTKSRCEFVDRMKPCHGLGMGLIPMRRSLQIWYIGCALVFQTNEVGSTPTICSCA
jgi:hypothetical protein